MRIAEIPIRFQEREAGRSKISLRVQIQSALISWKLLFDMRGDGAGRWW